ncbi:MAG: biopolymer transporter ExbD [Novosphingobium sp.]
MAMTGGKDDGSPMMEMNTTPLIDVMLVLLIMFIITIPVATHAVNIDLPAPNNNPPPVTVQPVKNKLVITDSDQIVWDGTVVTDGDLINLLKTSAKMKPEPELQYQPEQGASYYLSVNVLNWIKQTGVTKFGFVGNEAYSEFSKSPNAPKAE